MNEQVELSAPPKENKHVASGVGGHVEVPPRWYRKAIEPGFRPNVVVFASSCVIIFEPNDCIK